MANAAYDFSIFETSPKKSAAPGIKGANRPELKALERKKDKLSKQQKKNIRYTGMFLVGFIILAALFITSKVQYSELNTTYKEKNEELMQLQSMYVNLETRYESNISVDNIEDYAIDVLGMQIAESSQIKHISLTTEDNCRLTTDKSEFGILSSIKNIFS